MIYKQLFDQNLDAGLIIEPIENRILKANRTTIELLGFTEKELYELQASALFGDTLVHLITFTQQIIEQGNGWSDQLSLQHKDGSCTQIFCNAVHSNDSSPDVIVMMMQPVPVIIQRQIDTRGREHLEDGLLEWKRVEKLFTDFELQNELILNAAGEGIYGINAQGNTTFINPAAVDILNWTEDELLGKNIHNMIHYSHSDGSYYNEVDCPIFSAFRDGEVYQVENEVFWRKDGKAVPVEYTSTPIRQNGELVGAVVVFRDVSERNQANAKLREALNEVERLKQRLEMENTYLLEEIREEYNHHAIVGRSEVVRQVNRQIELVAPTDANVLITGESGTGKELIARAIHESSLLHDRPLIRVNCAAIPHELFESEFFGHIKGSFTGAVSDRAGRFELADNGTLFLDEVGELPLQLQAKLLRVIQEGTFEKLGDTRTHKVNVRIIAATNRDLKQYVDDGKYREDLYFRLNVFPIESAPLRKRVDDIPLLAKHFLKNASKRFGKHDRYITKSNMQKMLSYHWPGNIRELENVIERAVIVSTSHKIDIDLPIKSKRQNGINNTAHIGPSNEAHKILTDDDRYQRDRQMIIQALKQTGGKVFGPNGAAELLDVKPTTLASRIKRMGIKKPVKGTDE
jgi:formate hydrogenlyase transcriptional activator